MDAGKLVGFLVIGFALGFAAAVLRPRARRRRRGPSRPRATARGRTLRAVRLRVRPRRVTAPPPVKGKPVSDTAAFLPADWLDWVAGVPTVEPDPGAAAPPARSSRRAWLRSDSGEFPLIGITNRIGRSPNNDIVLGDDTISRHHVVIDYADDSWWLMPEVTGNGSYVNSALVQPGERVRLTGGDVLQLGPKVTVTLVAGATDDMADVPLRFRSVGRTTPGGRQSNEDAHVASEQVLAVADGVGGRVGGRIASRTAISSVAAIGPAVPLERAVQEAHEKILHDAQGGTGLHGMATTLDVVRIVKRPAGWLVEGAHVGDGWVFFQDAEGVAAVTRPDRLGERLAQLDPRRAAELQGDPDYDRLVAALGLDAGTLPVHTWSRPARAGQRVLLTSDGLLEVLDAETLVTLLDQHRHTPAGQFASLLLERARRSSDNVTVVVADVEPAGAAVADVSTGAGYTRPVMLQDTRTETSE